MSHKCPSENSCIRQTHSENILFLLPRLPSVPSASLRPWHGVTAPHPRLLSPSCPTPAHAAGSTDASHIQCVPSNASVFNCSNGLENCTEID